MVARTTCSPTARTSNLGHSNSGGGCMIKSLQTPREQFNPRVTHEELGLSWKRKNGDSHPRICGSNAHVITTTPVSLDSPHGQGDCSQTDRAKTSTHGRHGKGLPQPSTDPKGGCPTSAPWGQVCASRLVLPRFQELSGLAK